MRVKEKLIERFGLSDAEELEALDENNLFAKGGISVIASLAGFGKTTKMLKYKKQWEEQGYAVSYINFDKSTTYQSEMIESPTSREGIKLLLNIIETYAQGNDIIVIDSLKAAANYYELIVENSEDMYSFMIELRSITKKTKCSIILVHHVFRYKKLKAPVEHLYGSRAIEEQVDSAFILTEIDTVKIVKSRLNYRRNETIAI